MNCLPRHRPFALRSVMSWRPDGIYGSGIVLERRYCSPVPELASAALFTQTRRKFAELAASFFTQLEFSGEDIAED